MKTSEMPRSDGPDRTFGVPGLRIVGMPACD
jgi:hypothetical protein